MENCAVLWDLDGVLVDTSELHFKAWKETLTTVGLDLTEKDFARVNGMNNRRILQTLVGINISEDKIERLAGEKEKLFLKRRHLCRLFPGVLEWLKYFQTNGFKQAVASSAPQINIEILMKQFSIQKYFNLLQTSEGMAGKPDPQIFLTAAKKMQTQAQNCLVIEDSLAGIQAARNAKMRTLAVATSYPAEALSTADLVREDLTKVSKADIQKLFKA